MKPLLTYLSFLIFFLLQGNNPAFAHSSVTSPAVQHLDKADSKHFSEFPLSDSQSDESVFNDNDDDDFSPVARKTNQSRPVPSLSRQIVPDRFTHDLIISPSFCRHLCYLAANRYIVHRVLML